MPDIRQKLTPTARSSCSCLGIHLDMYVFLRRRRSTCQYLSMWILKKHVCHLSPNVWRCNA